MKRRERRKEGKREGRTLVASMERKEDEHKLKKK